MNLHILVDDQIFLRPVQVSDAEAALGDLSDPDFVKWMVIPPATLESIREYYEMLENQPEPKTDLVFAIIHNGNMKGCVGLHKINLRGETAEVGLWVSRKVWGQKVGSRAVRAICKFAKEELGLQGLAYPIHADNVASGKVAMAAGGFKFREGKGKWEKYGDEEIPFVTFLIRM